MLRNINSKIVGYITRISYQTISTQGQSSELKTLNTSKAKCVGMDNQEIALLSFNLIPCGVELSETLLIQSAARTKNDLYSNLTLSRFSLRKSALSRNDGYMFIFPSPGR